MTKCRLFADSGAADVDVREEAHAILRAAEPDRSEPRRCTSSRDTFGSQTKEVAPMESTTLDQAVESLLSPAAGRYWWR